MKIARFLLGVLLLAVVGDAFAQQSNVGGSRSRARFNALAVNAATGPANSFYVNSDDIRIFRPGSDSPYFSFWDQTNTVQRALIQSTGSGLYVQNLISGENIRIDTTGAGQVLVNGAPVALQTSGNFTASFNDACTTTPTATFGYVVSGGVVTMHVKAVSGFNCSSDSMSFEETGSFPVPANIRPTVTAGSVRSPMFACIDNSGGAWCAFVILSTGRMQMIRFDNNGLQASWTAAGNKGFLADGKMFAYYLGNP